MKEVVVLSLVFVVVVVFSSVGFGMNADEGNSTNSSTSGTSWSPSTETSSSVVTSHHSSTHDAVTTSSLVSSTTASPPKTHDLYALDGGNGSYCILIKANIYITVNYINATDNKTTSITVTVPAPGNVSVIGSCNEDNGKEQFISITFNKNWILTLGFKKVDDKYFQSNLSLEWDLTTSTLKNVNESGSIHIGTKLFETSTGYLCMARKMLYSNSSAVKDVSSIYTEKLHLEAFQQKPEPNLSDKYERCSEDSISNLVPIIVGACLGGLIIIVLIAYLIGRKRSRRGYESV